MKIKDIIKDVLENLRYHEKNMKMVGKNYYYYPRGKFISRWENPPPSSLDEKEIYN